MPIHRVLFTLLAVANAGVLPRGLQDGPNVPKDDHGHQQVLKFPDWHYVNATTPGAKPDGSFGVILEPDLVPGKPGKDGAIVTKVRSGPFHVRSGRSQEYPILPFPPPCVNCWITAMQLGLEYEDGKEANTDTGAWCHHIDLVRLGAGRVDYTCPSSLLSVLTFSDPAMFGERLFSSGNERTATRLNSKTKSGLKFDGYPVFGGSLEIMNENKNPIAVYMSLKFEYLPLSTPGYREAKFVWLDVTNCAHSSDFPAKRGKYELESQEFEMHHDADMLLAIAHLHDGGRSIELYVNGKLSCHSRAMYANRRGGYHEPADGTILPALYMPPGSHISDVAICRDWAEVKAGDRLKIRAYYDEGVHMQMRKANGDLERQMGIMYTYVGLKGPKKR